MISIIVPVYNAEIFLKRCIASLLHQTYTDIEVLLIDDGSTDNSATICQDFCHIDKRVKYYYKENGGVASARNYGIDQAIGEYLLFVDSDDYLALNAVEMLFSAALNTGADLTICGYVALSRVGVLDVSFGSGFFSGAKEISNMLSEKIGASIMNTCWGKLYKAEVICRKMDSAFPIGEDWVFNIMNLSNIHSIMILDNPLYRYECRNESITRSKYKLNVDIVDKMYRAILEELEALYHSEKINSEIKRMYLQSVVVDATETTYCWIQLKWALDKIKGKYALEIQTSSTKDKIDFFLKKKRSFGFAMYLRFKWIAKKIKSRILCFKYQCQKRFKKDDTENFVQKEFSYVKI